MLQAQGELLDTYASDAPAQGYLCVKAAQRDGVQHRPVMINKDAATVFCSTLQQINIPDWNSSRSRNNHSR